MYYSIVRSKLRASFEQVNQGNLSAVVAQFTGDAEHWFTGTHALGGRRQGTAQIRQWYKRLGVVMPDLHFDITGLAVNGMPWRTTAMVEWIDRFTDPDGNAYSNQGVHVIELRWGKISKLHIYCDTVLLCTALEHMAEQGRTEAAAELIGAPVPFAVGRLEGRRP
ncbi:MAG: nuclear transport factor 2 family protein [Ornithinimicrobium sp.]